ncbi:PP2C family protein-serine/threonine phosphatase [Actinomadura sp. DC4]|uniref:PP2C family protein-serine/threonine phosphatase n=1 Tax=Actinomadura sp. DC4 TaxID=3055069 RepID=UPI0025B20F70|nr:PP2C family protein-serine/threonine phosphatase [Actinomadura sp. DC4]MDN3357897.1 PP2C family protein-serine/threonine phosphatase [Actinomadura sp. DC4]
MTGDTSSDDALLGRCLTALLARAHLMRPDDLTTALEEESRALGIEQVRIYLADLQQRHLYPVPGGGSDPGQALAIESTLAGRAFQTVAVHQADGTVGETSSHRLWVPLTDGTERLGVMELIVDEITEVTLARCRALASLTGVLVISKSRYSDTFAQVRRDRPLTLPAEMVWAFMGPTTFATPQVVICAALEPAYDVGGDAFDYALLGDHLHLSLLDATGHDLAAGLIASVAIAACRNTRRAGGDLADIVAAADSAVADQFDDSRFATALVCDLDVGTGELRWITCGHPSPLLIRENKVVKELPRDPCLPLGLAGHDRAAVPGTRPPTHTEQLQPGDRVLLYTDGVVEGRSAVGGPFGQRRLSDFIIRHSSAGLSASETLRRLNRAIVGFQDDRLSDDATTVLLEWMPDDPQNRFTCYKPFDSGRHAPRGPDQPG